MLEGTVYDNYAYLFSKPTFISLDPNATVSDVDLSGIRIGVNGVEQKVGQTFSPLSTTVGGANYMKGIGQLLSVNASSGAVITQEKGAVRGRVLPHVREDRHAHAQRGEVDVPPSISTQEDTLPGRGRAHVRRAERDVRTSDRCFAAQPRELVVADLPNVKQQLPAVESIDAFLASHQTGIAQFLAIAYGAAMVDTQSHDGFGAGVNPASAGTIYDDGVRRRRVTPFGLEDLAAPRRRRRHEKQPITCA